MLLHYGVPPRKCSSTSDFDPWGGTPPRLQYLFNLTNKSYHARRGFFCSSKNVKIVKNHNLHENKVLPCAQGLFVTNKNLQNGKKHEIHETNVQNSTEGTQGGYSTPPLALFPYMPRTSERRLSWLANMCCKALLRRSMRVCMEL